MRKHLAEDPPQNCARNTPRQVSFQISGKKDKYVVFSGFNWPYVGLEIQQIWPFFQKPHAVVSQQVSSYSIIDGPQGMLKIVMHFKQISIHKIIQNRHCVLLLLNWLLLGHCIYFDKAKVISRSVLADCCHLFTRLIKIHHDLKETWG